MQTQMQMQMQRGWSFGWEAEMAGAVRQLLISMRVRFVCRSYRSQVDVMGATKADMGEFLWRAFVESGRTIHRAPPLCFQPK